MRDRNPLRVRLSLDVQVSVTGFPKPVPVTLLDLSESGCRLSAQSVFLTGSAIRVDLPLAGRGAVAAQGVVKRIMPVGEYGNFEYGIEFGTLAASDMAALRSFIAQEHERGSAVSDDIRVETEFPVTATVTGQKQSVVATAIDLSRGGMCLAVEQQLPDRSTLVLRFRLPHPSGASAEYQIRAKLVGCKRQFREFHHNLTFIDPSPAFLGDVDRFVRAVRLER